MPLIACCSSIFRSTFSSSSLHLSGPGPDLFFSRARSPPHSFIRSVLLESEQSSERALNREVTLTPAQQQQQQQPALVSRERRDGKQSRERSFARSRCAARKALAGTTDVPQPGEVFQTESSLQFDSSSARAAVLGLSWQSIGCITRDEEELMKSRSVKERPSLSSEE
ncbi:hypothetical protein MPTK1_1g25980 [Marchantia polymorpha subsp. ruderalis]